MTPPVLTFLSDPALKGKTVAPFMTNAGWPGTVLKDMTAAAKVSGANVLPGLEVRFDSGSNQLTPDADLSAWLKSLR